MVGTPPFSVYFHAQKKNSIVSVRSKPQYNLRYYDKEFALSVQVCEDEARKHLGKPQIFIVLKLVSKFIEDNPLSACSEEISKLRLMLGPEVRVFYLSCCINEACTFVTII